MNHEHDQINTQALKQLRTMHLSHAEKERMRSALSFLTTSSGKQIPRPIPSPLSFFSFVRAHATGAIALVLMCTVGASSVAAAENALPGETLYPLKLINEKAVAAVLPTPTRKAEWELERAERRLAEAAQLSAEDNLPEETRVALDQAVEESVGRAIAYATPAQPTEQLSVATERAVEIEHDDDNNKAVTKRRVETRAAHIRTTKRRIVDRHMVALSTESSDGPVATTLSLPVADLKEVSPTPSLAATTPEQQIEASAAMQNLMVANKERSAQKEEVRKKDTATSSVTQRKTKESSRSENRESVNEGEREAHKESLSHRTEQAEKALERAGKRFGKERFEGARAVLKNVEQIKKEASFAETQDERERAASLYEEGLAETLKVFDIIEDAKESERREKESGKNKRREDDQRDRGRERPNGVR